MEQNFTPCQKSGRNQWGWGRYQIQCLPFIQQILLLTTGKRGNPPPSQNCQARLKTKDYLEPKSHFILDSCGKSVVSDGGTATRRNTSILGAYLSTYASCLSVFVTLMIEHCTSFRRTSHSDLPSNTNMVIKAVSTTLYPSRKLTPMLEIKNPSPSDRQALYP